jgi:cellulose synthase/poly-beta-1,6-N-acetylglucosamine synthase-like glycosyltransferase/GGDEF domain-containing protein
MRVRQDRRSRPSPPAGVRLLATEAELGEAITRAAGDGGQASLAHIGLHEIPRLRALFGAEAEAEIARELADLVLRNTREGDVVAYLRRPPRFAVLMQEASPRAVTRRLDRLSRQIAGHDFRVGGEPVRVTPIVGLAGVPAGAAPQEVHRRAEAAVRQADARLDLLVARHDPAAAAARAEESPKTRRRVRALLAAAAGWAVATVVPLLLPLLVYLALAAAGLDVTPVVYLLVVAALVCTALAVYAESFAALGAPEPPKEPATPYPSATAIVVAYLPNEVATVLDTVRAVLRVDYPAPFQVILAYNSPAPLPIERALRELAARDPRFFPLRVETSTSKAQNVNAALREVRGEFVGIFDADHHPAPDSFRRAWRWLSHGWDVVQGHCAIRNGQVSWLSRLVAVEFETIYAVAHPGRARLHGFGVFGGSNGYWKTDCLHEIRMRMFMLTEDIDSSVRAVKAGHRIASDPGLLSHELSPATLGALWNQRMRWSQGWFQVSLRYLGELLRSRTLTTRQKVGMVYLLGWSQLYPWISGQIVPIVAFWTLRHGWQSIDWLIPIWVATSLLTLGTGPVRMLVAYRLGVAEQRRHPGWFFFYLLAEPVFYAPLKNLIVRLAQIQEIMGVKQWKVTPRGAEAPEPPIARAA